MSTRYCPNCGSPQTGRYCNNCGADLGAAAAPPPGNMGAAAAGAAGATTQVLLQGWRILSANLGFMAVIAASVLVLMVINAIGTILTSSATAGMHAVGSFGTPQFTFPASPPPVHLSALNAVLLLSGILVHLVGLVLGIYLYAGVYATTAELTGGGSFQLPRFLVAGWQRFWKTVGLSLMNIVVNIPFLIVLFLLAMLTILPATAFGVSFHMAAAAGTAVLGVFVIVIVILAYLAFYLPWLYYWIPATFVGPGVLQGMGQAWRLAFRSGGFGGMWAVLGITFGGAVAVLIPAVIFALIPFLGVVLDALLWSAAAGLLFGFLLVATYLLYRIKSGQPSASVA